MNLIEHRDNYIVENPSWRPNRSVQAFLVVSSALPWRHGVLMPIATLNARGVPEMAERGEVLR